MTVQTCEFHVVAAPLATSPPYELVVTAAPLSATIAAIRLAPVWVLFERTCTPPGGINDVVVESRCVQYETAHVPACGTATTGVECTVPEGAATRANAATGAVSEVPRWTTTARLAFVDADSATRTTLPASAATATFCQTTDRADPEASAATCDQPVTPVGADTVARLLVANNSNRLSPARTLAGIVTVCAVAEAFAVAPPTKLIALVGGGVMVGGAVVGGVVVVVVVDVVVVSPGYVVVVSSGSVVVVVVVVVVGASSLTSPTNRSSGTSLKF